MVRNRLHTLWLITGTEENRKKYANARRAARRAVRAAKDAWFQHKVLEAERGRNGGKLVWRCIRDIQRGRRGLVPVKTVVVKDDGGNTCTTAKAQQERWRRHFTKILNIQSYVDVEMLRKVRQRPPRPEMAEVPSEEELMSAGGGKSGILPEMVMVACYDEEFLSKLFELVKDIWEVGCVPSA